MIKGYFEGGTAFGEAALWWSRHAPHRIGFRRPLSPSFGLAASDLDFSDYPEAMADDALEESSFGDVGQPLWRLPANLANA